MGELEMRHVRKMHLYILMGSIFSLIQIKSQTRIFVKERNRSNNKSTPGLRVATHIWTRDWPGTVTTQAPHKPGGVTSKLCGLTISNVMCIFKICFQDVPGKQSLSCWRSYSKLIRISTCLRILGV